MYPVLFYGVIVTIEVDDIVVTSKAGFWKVVAKEVTQPYGNITYTYIVAKQIMTDSGIVMKKSKRQRKFHQSHCVKVDQAYITKCRQEDHIKWDTLSLLLNPEAEVEHVVASEIVEEFPEPSILHKLGMPNSLVAGVVK